jgi:putative FmdB family regulatory protein
MPLYEYECDACGHRFEKIQKFSDPLVDTCPKCGGAVHKLMSSPAIQFKGSGFYITDYAKKDHVASSKADGEGSGKSEKGEKSDKAEKSDKSQKADTATKSEKGASSGDSSSSGSSSASAPPASSPAKDSSS